MKIKIKMSVRNTTGKVIIIFILIFFMTVHKIKIVIKKYKNIYVIKATTLRKYCTVNRLTEDADADDDADENLHHPSTAITALRDLT